MKRLEVSVAVRPIYGSLGVKRLRKVCILVVFLTYAFETFRIMFELINSENIENLSRVNTTTVTIHFADNSL